MAHASTKERFERTGFPNEWDLAESSFIQGFLVAQDMAAKLCDEESEDERKWKETYETVEPDKLMASACGGGMYTARDLALEIRAMGSE